MVDGARRGIGGPPMGHRPAADATFTSWDGRSVTGRYLALPPAVDALDLAPDPDLPAADRARKPTREGNCRPIKSTKTQTPSTREAPITKLQRPSSPRAFWDFRFGNSLGFGAWNLGFPDYSVRARNRSRNDTPFVASLCSSFNVQSQSQQAHGSVPFSCRQLRRE
jgi:hypothetical protein